MKKTRQLIIINGEDADVRKALGVIDGFKAVVVTKKMYNMKKIFRCNKNCVIPMSAFEPQQKNPIIVNIDKSIFSSAGVYSIRVDNIKEDFAKLMEMLNIDIGDHVSENANTQLLSKEEVEDGCKMCKIVKRKNEKPERIIYDSKNFFVVPTVGAFVEGYVMIVPKKHVTSFAELNDKEFLEFIDVLNDTRFILQSVYNQPVFLFEGGSGKGGEGKNITSIVHAHIHLVPSDMDIIGKVCRCQIFPSLIKDSTTKVTKNFMKKYEKDPYLLLIDHEDNWFIENDQHIYYPRQFPRMLLADYLGLDDDVYNWRVNPYYENMDIIADTIQKYIRENFNSLSKRIQKNTKKFL